MSLLPLCLSNTTKINITQKIASLGIKAQLVKYLDTKGRDIVEIQQADQVYGLVLLNPCCFKWTENEHEEVYGAPASTDLSKHIAPLLKYSLCPYITQPSK